jgi:hypothetical protein
MILFKSDISTIIEGVYPLGASETEASWCFGFLRGRKSISSR